MFAVPAFPPVGAGDLLPAGIPAQMLQIAAATRAAAADQRPGDDLRFRAVRGPLCGGRGDGGRMLDRRILAIALAVIRATEHEELEEQVLRAARRRLLDG